jgi:hypothetical protein
MDCAGLKMDRAGDDRREHLCLNAVKELADAPRQRLEPWLQEIDRV